MKRVGLRFSVPVVGLGLVTGLFVGLGTGSALAAGQPRATASKATPITVTIGKPSEAGFKLSKKELIPAGTVIFKVTNSGKIGHSFQICLSPSTNASADVCDGLGQMTRLLESGQSQTVTVVLAKQGMYEFMGSLAGQATPGIKGLIGIGVKVKPVPVTTAKTVSGVFVPTPDDPDAAAAYACMVTSCDDDE